MELFLHNMLIKSQLHGNKKNCSVYLHVKYVFCLVIGHSDELKTIPLQPLNCIKILSLSRIPLDVPVVNTRTVRTNRKVTAFKLNITVEIIFSNINMLVSRLVSIMTERWTY